MKILVTGNMGYVGPCVVEHLRAAHPEAVLVGLDTGYFAHALTGGTALPERLLDIQLFGDVRTPPPDALRGVDAVVHLAAISNDPMGRSFEDVTFRHQPLCDGGSCEGGPRGRRVRLRLRLQL